MKTEIDTTKELEYTKDYTVAEAKKEISKNVLLMCKVKELEKYLEKLAKDWVSAILQQDHEELAILKEMVETETETMKKLTLKLSDSDVEFLCNNDIIFQDGEGGEDLVLIIK